MNKKLANRIDEYIQSGRKPEILMDECIEVGQEDEIYQALIAVEMLVNEEPNTVIIERYVTRVGGRDLFLPAYDYPTSALSNVGIVVLEPEYANGTVKCNCGRVLSQPYTIKMGECVKCCLHRIRKGRADRQA